MTQRFLTTRNAHHAVRITWCVLLIIAVAAPVIAQPKPIGHLMPTGDGYAEVYAAFSQEAVANAQNGQVNILVLPVAYSTNAIAITEAERATNIRETDARRQQIEEACQHAANNRMQCTAILAPIFTRTDASDPSIIKYFLVDLSAVFILDGDQTIAMQIMTDTPLETELAKAYANGVIVAGTGAGGSLLSATMLGGYHQNFAADHSLDFGAVDVWPALTSRQGLPFGVQDAIFDQRFYQQNHFGRLLNAIALPKSPHVGIGLDANTGVNVYGGVRLQDIFGLDTVTVLDAETYHAAEAVQYRSPNSLSLRNVLVHLLAPGRVSYDLDNRLVTLQGQIQNPRSKIDRTFNALALPKNAGPLIIAGDLSGALTDNTILVRFLELAGKGHAKALIVAMGYDSDVAAQSAAESYAQALGVRSDVVVIPNDAPAAPLVVTKDITGIVLVARDQSKVKLQSLSLIEAAWRGGLPLFVDDAGAAITGKFFSAHAPTPADSNEAGLAVQQSFIRGNTTISNGLSLLNVLIEPQVLNDNRWGSWFSLAYAHPDLIALGLTRNTALEISTDGAHVIGDNVVFALDLRNSQRALGTGDQFIIANGLLDVFAPGDEVKPALADVEAAPSPAPTPVQPTSTPLPTATPQPTLTPTSTPPTLRPTATPTLAPTLIPTPAPIDVASTPVFPLAIVGGAIILLVVLLAARRPATP